MARPALSDWEHVFDFSEDPTPGSPEILDLLASEYRSVAREADDAYSVVSRLDSNDLGEGKAMEELRKKLAELPDQVRRLQTSYEAAADAVSKYAGKLRDGQDQADRAMEQGREAKDRLMAATVVASAASSHVKRLDDQDAPPPDDKDGRSKARSAMADAKQAESEAAGSVDSAQRDLDAARMLANDAHEIRTSDAGMAKRELEDAESESVDGLSFWDKIGDILNTVFSMLGAVIGIIAMFVAGPVGLLLAAVSIGFGAAALGLTIQKGRDTGNWDVMGIVLGALGLGAGVGAFAKAGTAFVKGVGGALKGGGSLFKGSGSAYKGGSDALKGAKGGLGDVLKGQWGKGVNWGKGQWANMFKPKPPPSSNIPMNTLKPPPNFSRPQPYNPRPLNFDRSPPPNFSRPQPYAPRPLNTGSPQPSTSPLGLGLDSVGAAMAVGGFIYAPISKEGKNSKVSVQT